MVDDVAGSVLDVVVVVVSVLPSPSLLLVFSLVVLLDLDCIDTTEERDVWRLAIAGFFEDFLLLVP